MAQNQKRPTNWIQLKHSTSVFIPVISLFPLQQKLPKLSPIFPLPKSTFQPHRAQKQFLFQIISLINCTTARYHFWSAFWGGAKVRLISLKRTCQPQGRWISRPRELFPFLPPPLFFLVKNQTGIFPSIERFFTRCLTNSSFIFSRIYFFRNGEMQNPKEKQTFNPRNWRESGSKHSKNWRRRRRRDAPEKREVKASRISIYLPHRDAMLWRGEVIYWGPRRPAKESALSRGGVIGSMAASEGKVWAWYFYRI